MHVWALALALVFLPPATAQPEAQDLVADVEWRVGDSPVAHGGRDSPRAADLTAVGWLDERPETVIGFVELADPHEHNSFLGEWHLHFSFKEVQHRVVWRAGEEVVAVLERADAATGDWWQVALLHSQVDGNRVLAEIPKALIRDETGRSILTGQRIESTAARTVFDVAAGPVPVWARDSAPDSGGLPDFELHVPALAFGPLAFPVANLTLFSNGNIPVHAFEATVHNYGEDDRLVELTLIDIPPGWQVSAPPMLLVPAGGAAHVPVVLSVPSAHSHGEWTSFALRVADSEQSSWAGEMTLAVKFESIPQPAGHHPMLWIHSEHVPDGPATGHIEAWMNALRQDARSDGSGIPASSILTGASWLISLEPSLNLGLSFSGVRGSATIVIETPTVIPDAALVVETLYCDPSKNGSTATCPQGELVPRLRGETAVGTVMPGTFTGELDLEPLQGPNALPPRAGANLLARVVLTGDPYAPVGMNTNPMLIPERSSLTLPLLEYLPDIEVGTADGLTLTPLAENATAAVDGQTRLQFGLKRSIGLAEVYLQTAGPAATSASWETSRVVAGPAGTTVSLLLAPESTAKVGDNLRFYAMASTASGSVFLPLDVTLVDPHATGSSPTQGAPAGAFVPACLVLFVLPARLRRAHVAPRAGEASGRGQPPVERAP